MITASALFWAHFSTRIRYNESVFNGVVELFLRIFLGCVILGLTALLWEAQLRRADRLGRKRGALQTIADFASILGLIVPGMIGSILGAHAYRRISGSDDYPDGIVQRLSAMASCLIGGIGGCFLGVLVARCVHDRERRKS